jgi:hypothetical protein
MVLDQEKYHTNVYLIFVLPLPHGLSFAYHGRLGEVWK